MSSATVSSILREFLRKKWRKRHPHLPFVLSTRGNELLLQLLHSRNLCFHRDYDTTDLGLKLEYSDLN